MSHGPSTLGIITTSRRSPMASTSVLKSSRHQGESRLLTRVQSGVPPRSTVRPIFASPSRAATLRSAGMASSRLPSRMSVFFATSGSLAAIFSFDGSKKWMQRDGVTGISRTGSGAPSARGLKNDRGFRIGPEATTPAWATEMRNPGGSLHVHDALEARAAGRREPFAVSLAYGQLQPIASGRLGIDEPRPEGNGLVRRDVLRKLQFLHDRSGWRRARGERSPRGLHVDLASIRCAEADEGRHGDRPRGLTAIGDRETEAAAAPARGDGRQHAGDLRLGI